MSDPQLDLAAARELGLDAVTAEQLQAEGVPVMFATAPVYVANEDTGTWTTWSPTKGGADGARALEWLLERGHSLLFEPCTDGRIQLLWSVDCEPMPDIIEPTIWLAICRAVVALGEK